MAERDFKGVWIPKEIWLAEDIGWSAKMLLVEIDSLAMNGECFASNEYLGKFFGLSKDRISGLVRELRDKGYVEVELIYKTGTKQIDKRRITTRGYRRKCLQGIGENADTPICKNADTPIGENAEDINTGVINTSLINTEEKKPAAPPPASEPPFGSELQEAFKDWLQYKKERKEEYKPTGLKSLITEIRNNAAKYGEAAVAAEIRTSMARGWRGIVFDRLKEAEKRTGSAPVGRREPTPNWMQSHIDRVKAARTVADDTELAARAAALRDSLQK